MLNFFSNFRAANKPVETDRQRFERVIEELYDIMAAMPVRPEVTIDLATGRLRIATPDQFPDEALALPKPEPEAESGPDSKAA